MMRVEISQEINGQWNRAVIEDDTCDLSETVNMCERALRGVGFCFNGNLDILIPEPIIPEDFNWDKVMEQEAQEESEVIEPVAKSKKLVGKGKKTCKKC